MTNAVFVESSVLQVGILRPQLPGAVKENLNDPPGMTEDTDSAEKQTNSHTDAWYVVIIQRMLGENMTENRAWTELIPQLTIRHDTLNVVMRFKIGFTQPAVCDYAAQNTIRHLYLNVL